MERKTAGLLGALAGVAALGAGSAQAASHAAVMPPAPLAVTSYSDLLRPVPNAVEALKAHNAELAEQASKEPVEQVQWYPEGDGYDHHHHHHHHHHHDYYAPPPPPPYWYHHHHHHHHHHHSGAVILLPGIGVEIN